MRWQPYPASSNMAVLAGRPLPPAKQIWPDISALQLLQRWPLVSEGTVRLKGLYERLLQPSIQLKLPAGPSIQSACRDAAPTLYADRQK